MGAALCLLLTSCKVDAHLGVRVAEDGSGSVEARFVLDRDALAALGGGDLSRRLRAADLVQAGWTVEVEGAEDGGGGAGGARIAAEKGFATPGELTEVVDELSGRVGPFRGFALTRHRSAFSTGFTFEGRVDLRGGVGPSSLDPGDEGVVAELEGEGVEIGALREFLRERIDEAVGLEVVVDLPGDGSHNAPHEARGEPRWTPRPGEAVELRAESKEQDLDRIALVALGALLAAAALWLLFARGRG